MAAGRPRKIDQALDVFVSLAAAAVIYGALRKITHASDADTWLTWGLITEAIIFLIYGLLYLISPPYEKAGTLVEAKVMNAGNPALASMDKMLADAEINPTNLKKLGESFNKLGNTVNGLGEIGDVVKSTNDFSAKTKDAGIALTNMKDAFASSAATMGAFSTASESAKGFHDQVQVLTKNLGSLNTIYELELKESNNHLKALNGFYGKMAEASNVMMTTVDDATKAKDQISSLATNLTKLNSVYGNMLSAMKA